MGVGRGSSCEGSAAPLVIIVLFVLTASLCLTSSSQEFRPSFSQPVNYFPSLPTYTIRRGGAGPKDHCNGKKTVLGYLYYYSPQQYAMQEKSGYEYSMGLFVTMFLVPLVALLGISYAVPATGLQIGIRRSLNEGETTFIKDMNEVQERLRQIYLAATGSKSCLRRLVCGLGASKQNLVDHYKYLVVRFFDLWTPKVYKAFTSDYLEGLLEKSCSRFTCGTSPPKGHNKIK